MQVAKLKESVRRKTTQAHSPNDPKLPRRVRLSLRSWPTYANKLHLIDMSDSSTLSASEQSDVSSRIAPAANSSSTGIVADNDVSINNPPAKHSARTKPNPGSSIRINRHNGHSVTEMSRAPLSSSKLVNAATIPFPTTISELKKDGEEAVQKVETSPPLQHKLPVSSRESKGPEVNEMLAKNLTTSGLPPSTDLVDHIAGMYRILDLVSEQGSGGLGTAYLIQTDRLTDTSSP